MTIFLAIKLKGLESIVKLYCLTEDCQFNGNALRLAEVDKMIHEQNGCLTIQY
jgi:hypothetical protein